MSRTRKRGWLTTILFTAAVLIGGAMYSDKVKEYAVKLPIIGEWFNK